MTGNFGFMLQKGHKSTIKVSLKKSMQLKDNISRLIALCEEQTKVQDDIQSASHYCKIKTRMIRSCITLKVSWDGFAI